MAAPLKQLLAIEARALDGQLRVSMLMNGGLVLVTAFPLFILKKSPFACYAFPRWQSALAITMIGVLMGLDPAARAGVPGMPLSMAILMAVLTIWVTLPVIVRINTWWLKRGGRWDGQGDLFNLLVASWLVANMLGAGLVTLGIPPLITLPLWLYSIWISANALSGAIPKVSSGYALQGIVLSIIPAFLISVIAMGLFGFAMAVLTGAPPVVR